MELLDFVQFICGQVELTGVIVPGEEPDVLKDLIRQTFVNATLNHGGHRVTFENGDSFFGRSAGADVDAALTDLANAIRGKKLLAGNAVYQAPQHLKHTYRYRAYTRSNNPLKALLKSTKSIKAPS